MRSTVGQVLVNDALPEDLRDHKRTLDKKGLKELLQLVHDNYPKQYRDIVQRLSEIGAMSVYRSGHSLSIASLKSPTDKKAIINRLKKDIAGVLRNRAWDEERKREEIVKVTEPYKDELMTAVQKDTGNPFSIQVSSGSRGNPGGLNSLRGADLLYQDAKDRVIPVPVINSYSEGLDPAEYWAGSYGARKGMIDVKMATAKAGFFAKQVAQAAHRLVVTEKDCETENGIPVGADDVDSIGALLAREIDGFDRDDIIDAKMLKKLGRKSVIVRSPLTCQARNGLCAKCAGIRERGKLPDIGDHVGISAVQALSERLSQGQLSSKHTGGVVGAAGAVSGFELINQLIKIPKMFKGGAAISELDGRVNLVEEAPQGGKYITVGDQKHYVMPELNPTVAIGDTVEAGDVLSEGIPNPAKIVHHKGIGEGRLYFTNQFVKAFRDSGQFANRRNAEFLARGLINHVRVMDEDAGDDVVPNDLIEYDSLARRYSPRMGAKFVAPNMAKGKFLERPVLHYSVGTRITPTVAKQMKIHNIPKIHVHDDEPSFIPEMHRAMETLTTAEDWQTRLGGFHLAKGLRSAVERGAVSTTEDVSFFPRIAAGKPLFGHEEAVKVSPVL